MNNHSLLTKLLNILRKSRQHRWISLLMDLLVMAIVVWGFQLWQTRNLLPENGTLPAPDFELTALDGKRYRLSEQKGSQVFLYFFAPWCQVCSLNVSNLADLKQAREDEGLIIWLVALSWDNPNQVQKFAEKHDIRLPILLGNAEVSGNFRIQAFPTWYVINRDGMVLDSVVGYSPAWIMRWKTFNI
ncbi:MAG: TlpA family protein disulfide reductase [SAR324 cluster bacterium]|nr:TlpA family protein disulfide reductase [SAR324 cluster bacterium]